MSTWHSSAQWRRARSYLLNRSVDERIVGGGRLVNRKVDEAAGLLVTGPQATLIAVGLISAASGPATPSPALTSSSWTRPPTTWRTNCTSARSAVWPTASTEK